MTMTALSTEPSQSVETLSIKRDLLIAASPTIVFETLLDSPGPSKDLQIKIEPFPGGRWFRDLPNNTGHLWGHVQVIKPPTLLELVGPMFMSYPAISHVQYRLTPEGKGTRLAILHRAVGLMSEQHLQGVHMGWDHSLAALQEESEKKAHTRN